MSKFAEYETIIKDEKHLLHALAQMGFSQTEVCREPQTLYGYHGDARPEKAHVIIRRKHIGSFSNDVGFLRGEDGTYRAIISDYDRYRFNDSWVGRLKQSYTESRMMTQAKAKGYIFKGREVVKVNGKDHVKLLFGAR